MPKPTRKYRLHIGRPCGLGFEHMDMGVFMFELGVWACQNRETLIDVSLATSVSSRILLNRNILAKQALELNADYLLMLDPDMKPDMYVGAGSPAKKFMESSWQHALENPCSVIAAPAVGEPPKSVTNVFITGADDNARRMTHEECAERQANPCIEQVVGMGTGLILIDTLVFRRLQQPWFDDVYTDETKTDLKLSQDVYFTTNCAAAGMPVYCNHYAWAGHQKTVLLGCPGVKDVDQDAFKPAVAAAEFYPLPITLRGLAAGA